MTRAAGTLLTAAVFLLPAGVTQSTRSAAGSSSPNRSPIVVNSLHPLHVDGKVNFARALELAAADPRDNVIRFDPAIVAGEVTIPLAAPIVPPEERAGRDLIEGPADGGSVTLDGSACPDAALILGGGLDFSLSHVTVRGGGQRAILVKERARLTLDHVTLRSQSGPGIALFGESRLEARHCRLDEAQTHGLEVHGNCSVDLASVEISGCQQSGVAGFEQAVIRARQSRLDRNAHWNLVLTGSAAAELEDCTLAGARFANTDISETTKLTTRGCILQDGQRFGLFATGEAKAELRYTRVSGHGSRGIEMQDGAALVLEGAEVDSNRDYGVILFEKCSIRAEGSKFTRNQGHGVSLRGHATGDFEICLFAGNRYSGLGCLDARDGGKVATSRCLFQGNGMRPIYRGPSHLDPLVPTPLSIDARRVACVADPNAIVELYLDRAGEASRYLRTIQADARGRFSVDRSDVPPGWVMAATARTGGSTSEFNVIAGSLATDVLGALLARTGPLSDTGGDTDLNGDLRRWRSGTKLILHLENPPSATVERYARFVTDHVADWTRGALRAELSVGPNARAASDDVIVPVQYLAADAPALLGRGGVTFMKWDARGHFISPMKILLATGKEPGETCPRVLAHEFGHVLGLCHARVGLLSRMQGSLAPSDAFVNDFSPMMTFYDVLALHILHDPQWEGGGSTTLRQVVRAGMLPPLPQAAVASIRPVSDQPTYSPPAQEPGPEPHQATRP